MTRGVGIGALIALAAAAGLFLFPPDSDGAFAAFDGVLFGAQAEEEPARSIGAHHPLFHALAAALTEPLRALGVPMPGHYAIRILSGLGACVILAFIVRAAGRRRWAVGAGFAGVVLVTRQFLVDAAVGESILPAIAAACWMLFEATRRPVRWLRLGFAIVIALLLRQDNVLFVPGIAIAVAIGVGSPRPIGRLATLLVVTGATTLAAYAVAWRIGTGGTIPFPTWLVYLAHFGEWNGPAPFEPAKFLVHLDSLGAAVTGRTWQWQETNVLVGPSFVGVLVAAGILLQARRRDPALLVAIASTLFIRTLLFMWFDVRNPEWSVMTVCLVALFCSRMGDGEPRWAPPARVAGSLLLAGLAATVLAWHGPFTRQLRDRHFITTVQGTVQACKDCRMIALGPHADLALRVLHVKHVTPRPWYDVTAMIEEVQLELASYPEPTMIVLDRWIGAADPAAIVGWRAARIFLDDAELPPGFRMLRSDGRVYAIQYDPAASGR